MFSLKRRIQIIITLLIVLISTVLTAYYVYQFNRNSAERSLQLSQSTEIIFNAALSDLDHFYTYRAYATLVQSGIKEAMLGRDTYRLYDLVLPRYRLLQEENSYLNIMQFHAPDGRSILRVHQKDIFGDDIASRRPMVALAHRSHTVQTGFEGGIAGIAYRVIVPYSENRTYVGALEFGIDIDYITDKIRKVTGSETVFMLHQSRIAAADKQKYRFNYGEYYSLEQTGYQKNIMEIFSAENPQLIKRIIKYAGRDYEIIPITIDGHDGIPIGMLFCINNISGYNDLHEVILGSLALTGVLLAIFLSLYEYVFALTMRKVHFQDEYITTILNSQKNIIVVTDGKHIIYVNDAFLEYLHYHDLAAFKKEYPCICYLFETSETEKYLQPEMEGMTWTEYIIKYEGQEHKAKITVDGNTSIFSVNAKKMEHGEEIRYVVVFTDITKLNLLATRDTLTSLPNRFEFDKVLDHSISVARRYGKTFSVLLIDIDFFKQVNDTYGHLVGDEVLIHFSELLSAQIRESDFVARWGGEEFMLLLPNTPLNAAVKMGESLRQRVEIQPFETVGNMTCSIGIAEFNPDEDADSFLHRVDENLYTAKNSGRNKVVS